MHTRPLPIVITPDLAHSSGTTVCGQGMRTGRPQAEKGMDRPRLGRNQPARHPLPPAGARRTEEASRPVRPLAAAAPAPLWTHPRATRAPRLAGVPAKSRAIRILPAVWRTWGFPGVRQASACRSVPLPCRRQGPSVRSRRAAPRRLSRSRRGGGRSERPATGCRPWARATASARRASGNQAQAPSLSISTRKTGDVVE